MHRLAEELVVDELELEEVTIEPAITPIGHREHSHPVHVAVAECERREIRTRALHSRRRNRRRFVHRDHLHPNARATRIGVRCYRGLGEKWLRAQNALRLGASEWRAWLSLLEQQIAADHLGCR